MAEYVVMPEQHLVPVPEGLDLAIAAVGEPLSVAVYAVDVQAQIEPGQRVLVPGPGPIGIFCGMLAKLRGAEVLLTGVGRDSESRLPVAERAGLSTANSSEKPLEDHLRDGFGDYAPDVWIESSGSVRALGSALEFVRSGGTVAVVGLYAEEMSFPPPTQYAERSACCSVTPAIPRTIRRLWICWEAAFWTPNRCSRSIHSRMPSRLSRRLAGAGR
jgi:threonine dehydrogenase-like Zn-dependent dehydrogenase